MQVQVKDGLASVLAVVNDDPKARLVQPLLLRHQLGDVHEVPEYGLVLLFSLRKTQMGLVEW